jgi:3-oxoacyl-[acyl-carrier-protein] synthase-3
MVDTTDEWITTRTGIKERRIAAKNEFTSDLAAQAALRAMQRAGVTAEQIDLIIVATITPDMPFPSTACLVQRKIGAHRAAAFDLEAACSGFIYGLEIAQQFIMSRTYDTVLVIGAEKLSSIVDWKDRNTCVLFGDGAGAAVLQNRPNAHGLLTAVMGADGRKADLLFMAGRRQPLPGDGRISRLGHALPAHGRQGDLQECGAGDADRRGSLAPL